MPHPHETCGLGVSGWLGGGLPAAAKTVPIRRWEGGQGGQTGRLAKKIHLPKLCLEITFIDYQINRCSF